MKRLLANAKRCLFLLGLLFFSSLSALAVDDPYTITDIYVEVDRAQLVQARQNALSRAAEQGIVQLLQQLTPRSHWHRHQEIMAQLPLELAVSSFSIVEEENSDKYRATFNLQFAAEPIKNILTSQAIPFGETGQVQVVILPLLELPERKLLWSEINPWLKSWRDVAPNFQDPLFTPLVPVGDALEMQLVTPDTAAAGAEEQLIGLANNYSAQLAVVAHAQLRRRARSQLLEVTAYWYGRGIDDSLAPVGITIPLDDGRPFQEALDIAANRLAEGLATRWRTARLIRTDQPGRVYIRYAASGARDLHNFQEKLTEIEQIRAVNLKLLSLDRAVLQLDFFGAPSQLERVLRRAGWQVEVDGGLWAISPQT